jgi:DNA-binding transcriptional MocR family regulator
MMDIEFPPLELHVDVQTSRELANAVSRAVGDGSLPAGTRLPPIRAVASQFHISPTTVSAAWGLLARSGTIHTDGRRGTFVTVRAPAVPSRYRRALERSVHFELDLSAGVPDPALLPDLGPALRRLHTNTAPETYLDEPVLPELLDVLRAEWPYPCETITIVDGALDALEMIVSQFVRLGDLVAVEDPSFPPLLDLLDAAGAQLVPVELDDNGPLPAAVLAAREAGARSFFLQPRGQNPTGASVSAQRAGELAAILEDADMLLVENDSTGAIASSPLASLGAYLPDRTLHIRGFSKSHGPDLRLAALGGPAELLDKLIERRRLGQGWTSRLLQRLLLDLLSYRTSVNQVQRARREYACRRSALIGELEAVGVTVGGGDGLNIWLPVADEATALVSLASQGIGAAAGGPFMIRTEQGPHVRVTAGIVSSGHAELAAALASAADGATAGRRAVRR